MNNQSASKKLNWGHWLTITIVTMCCGIIFLVYKATTYNYDMVLPNYYEEELKFNDQQAATKNALNLSQPLRIGQDNSFIFIEFPPECSGKDINGQVQLYRASDASKDIVMPISFVSGTVMAIPATHTVKGAYILKADWQIDGKEYRVNKEFNVQ